MTNSIDLSFFIQRTRRYAVKTELLRLITGTTWWDDGSKSVRLATHKCHHYCNYLAHETKNCNFNFVVNSFCFFLSTDLTFFLYNANCLFVAAHVFVLNVIIEVIQTLIIRQGWKLNSFCKSMWRMYFCAEFTVNKTGMTCLDHWLSKSQ